jgi:hypothetical protein
MTCDWDGNRRHPCWDFAASLPATRGTRPLPLDPLPSSPFQSIVARSSRRSLTQNRLEQFHLNPEPRHAG